MNLPQQARPSRHQLLHSRRDFFKTVMGRALAGASILEIAQYQAAWAQALAPTADPTLFEIRKAAEGVYQAFAKPNAILNSNGVIYVNSKEVIIVDSHSRPSSAASLVAQIKKEITDKPVRYLVDTHFHWDHAHGNATYGHLGAKIVASKTTQRLMAETSANRVKGTLEPGGKIALGMASVPTLIETAKGNLAKASSPADADALKIRLQQLDAYAAEMKNFSPTLPGVTFDKSYKIKDKDFDLILQFNGRAHTAGDTQVHCPSRGTIATGDVAAPFMGDGYPRDWAKTLDTIMKLKFDIILPGHGPIQTDRMQMMGVRNYVEELTARVVAGKEAGQSVADLQKTVTIASLKSLATGGDFLAIFGGRATTTQTQATLNNNILHMYDRLDLK